MLKNDRIRPIGEFITSIPGKLNMPNADVTLDGGNCIVDGNWLLVKCLDIKLDAPSRRSNNTGERRALVHGFGDELIVNYADDYPGGVTIRGEVRFTGKIKQNHLRIEGTDLHLDHPDRRSVAGGERRALVHGFSDELVLNWAKDYPGGTVAHGNLEVQKSGKLRMRNSSGNVTTEIDAGGNLTLGGNGADGDIICKDSDGTTVFHLDSQYKRMDFKDSAGTTRVRIDTDDFTSTAWPAWEGEAVPTRLDLIQEIRRLKQELIALRAEVAALSEA